MDDNDPVGIVLVTSGSRGDRLWFRYPYETYDIETTVEKSQYRNPYSLRIDEDFQNNSTAPKSSISNGILVGYSDDILANLLAVRVGLCGSRFELKIDDAVLVGFPLTLHHASSVQPSPNRNIPSIISISVVFVLRDNVADSVIACYQDLSKQFAVALKHEERRCGYLSNQTAAMLALHDEVASLPEDSLESPFHLILKKCQLAKQLKLAYESLCSTGIVHLYINGWVEVNMCLPHKIHRLPHDQDLKIDLESIQRNLSALRPYHAMLLLVSEQEISESIPHDCSPSILRLIQVASPLKSLQTISSDADISLAQVFQIVSHLVYWAKAMIIYPLCENNIYVLSPTAQTSANSSLCEQFADQFKNISLQAVMCEFSLPSPLGEHRDVLGLPQQQAQQVQIVVWMLRHRLLLQLHTYIYFLPPQTYKSPNPVPASATAIFPPPTNGEHSDSLKDLSSSDVMSLLSEENRSLSTYSKTTPSVEVWSDGQVITEETRAQWQHQELLLSHLSQSQRDSITVLQAAHNLDDLKLFARLLPYLDGKHHLEEIMYYENVRRSQLLTLVDKFRDVLITCQHPDPATMIHTRQQLRTR